jgi:hypothetical protein
MPSGLKAEMDEALRVNCFSISRIRKSVDVKCISLQALPEKNRLIWFVYLPLFAHALTCKRPLASGRLNSTIDFVGTQ